MFKIIETILGVVLTNKIRIIIGDSKRNPLYSLSIALYEGYIRTFKNGSDYMKFYLVVGLIANIFLFSGFFAFIIIIASDFYIFKTVLK